MTVDDLRLRFLGVQFAAAQVRRKELDETDDDASRLDNDARWLGIVREILSLRAATPAGIRLKGIVVEEVISAVGTANDLVLDAARSLARDVRSVRRPRR